MKIIGGKFKNRNIYMPKEIRPTQNVVRKAVFDFIGQNLDGIEFLELFAGSGAVGIEALSRGAQKVTFVEKDAKCAHVIEENLNILGVSNNSESSHQYELLNTDSFAAIKIFHLNKRQFDVVFIDPPYGRDLTKKALKTLCGYDILHPNSILVIEHNKNETLPDKEGHFFLYKQKRYGISLLSIYTISK